MVSLWNKSILCDFLLNLHSIRGQSEIFHNFKNKTATKFSITKKTNSIYQKFRSLSQMDGIIDFTYKLEKQH